MHRSPSTILVVDDDPSAQLNTVKLLQLRDYTVATAWTLEEAYARVTADCIDLLVAGARIGSLSGLQFLISCVSRRPDVAAILIARQREHISEMDAYRHGITPLVMPLDPEQFLMTVAEKLAAIRRRQRWPRKRIDSEIPVEIGGVPGRLVDVSYGGLRFETPGESYDLRSIVQIDIPVAALRVNAELVWSARAANGASCVCGVSIIGREHPVPIWREFVDNVA